MTLLKTYAPETLSDIQSPISVPLRPKLSEATKPPLRIALFSGNYNCVRDGANQALNRLVAYMENKAGAEVRVYSPTIAQPAFEPAGTLVSVPSLPIPGRSEYRIALGLSRSIKNDLKHFAPDIIHVSAPDILGRQAQHYARATSTPIATSFHTRFETYFEYYGMGFMKQKICRYLDRFYGSSDLVLVPNAAIADEMAANGLGARTSIWSRGVDRTIFTPTLRSDDWRYNMGYAPDDIVLLFFGRLVREKGVDIFAQIIANLRAKGHRLRPLVIGDGPERTAFARILPNVNFLGHLAGEDLGRAVANADILLNPSVTEAFGNVTLEAMAAGVAVVSADVPSAQALITHEKSGLLIDPYNIDAYSDAVISLINDNNKRKKLSQSALETALHFDWDAVLATVSDAYHKLLVRYNQV